MKSMWIQLELFYLFYTIEQILLNIHTTLFCSPFYFFQTNEIRMR